MKTATDRESRRAKPTEADKAAAARLKALWDQAKQDRIRHGHAPLTQDEAADTLGVNQSAVSQYLHGAIPLNYRALLGFSRLLGIEPTAIRTDLPEQQLTSRVEETTAEYEDWLSVLGYSQAVGLGAGAEAQEYAETHKLKFKATSLRRKGLRPQHLAIYYGKGDSMEPRIKDGDAILFDTSDTRPADDGIFIIQRGKEIYAKRCEILDDTAYFRSDNPTGDHNWRKAMRMSNKKEPLTILGRVRWFGSWEK